MASYHCIPDQRRAGVDKTRVQLNERGTCGKFGCGILALHDPANPDYRHRSFKRRNQSDQHQICCRRYRCTAEATSFRCESPDQLARFLFERGLVRGCDIEADDNLLHVRWHDPERFYSQGRFHQLLLESGVRIFEVQSTESLLEKATGHAQET